MNYRLLMAIGLSAFTLTGCATGGGRMPPEVGYQRQYVPADYLDRQESYRDISPEYMKALDPRYNKAMRDGG